ncbi:ankyrin, partial [Tuber magnatum]
GETGTITRLLEWGLDVNAVNHSGRTLLHRTAMPDATAPDITRGWRVSIAELLLVHPDIEVNLVDRKGRTALRLAAVYGAGRLSKPLLEHPDIMLSIAHGYGDTPLHVAVGRQCKRTTHALLEAGADAVHHDGDGATP